jgi:serine/threonine protein kinase
VWKVADFGLTSQGTSQSLHYTEFARGTSGYRAPELLLQDTAVYNNKVDIWALGCILFELVVGTKPFTTDRYPCETPKFGFPQFLQITRILKSGFPDFGSISWSRNILIDFLLTKQRFLWFEDLQRLKR